MITDTRKLIFWIILHHIATIMLACGVVYFASRNNALWKLDAGFAVLTFCAGWDRLNDLAHRSSPSPQAPSVHTSGPTD